MKVRRLMQLLNEMGPDNDIFVQEVTSEGRIVVETTYTIIEVPHSRGGKQLVRILGTMTP
jgi:hypothetical protein